MELSFKTKHRIIDFFATLCALIIVFGSFAMPASTASAGNGYESWIRDTSNSQGGLTLTGAPTVKDYAFDPDSVDKNDDPNPIEKIIAELVGWLGTCIRLGFKASGVDASVTGIMMGNIINGINYFVFDLTSGNIYGIVGATIYVAMRAIFMVFLFISALLRVILPLWKGDSRGGALIKDALATFTISLLLIIVMPLIVDWACNLRDKLSIVIFNQCNSVVNGITVGDKSVVGNVRLSQTIEQAYYTAYHASPTLVNGIVYLAVCCLPIIFVVNYVKVALSQTVIFGMYPMFCFLGTLDGNKTSGRWLITFISNCFIPCIDMALMFVPAILIAVIDLQTGNEHSLLKAVMVIVCFGGIIPTRNVLLGLLGNSVQVPADHSIAGLLGAVGAAAVSTIGAVHGAFSDYKDANKDIDSRAAEAEAADKALNASENLSEKANGPDDLDKGQDDAVKGNGDDGTSGEKSDDNIDALQGENGDGGQPNENLEVPDDGAIGGPDEFKADGPESNTDAQADAEANVNVENGNAGDTVSDAVAQDKALNDNDPATMAVTPADLEKLDEKGNLLEKSESGDSLAQKINDNSYVNDNTGADHRDFNMSRAANLQSMDNMSQKVSELNKENQGLVQRNASLQSDITKEQTKIDNIYKGAGFAQRENGQWYHPDGGKLTDMQKSDIASARNTINTKQNQINENNARIGVNNANKDVLGTEIDRRKGLEKDYAEKYASTGRSGQTYTNAEDFANNLAREHKMAEIVNFENYRDKKFDGVLTDAQRLQFERQAAKQELRTRLVDISSQTAAKAAGAVALAPVAVAMAASGDGGATAGKFLKSAAPSVGSVPGRVAVKAAVKGGSVVGKRVVAPTAKALGRAAKASPMGQMAGDIKEAVQSRKASGGGTSKPSVKDDESTARNRRHDNDTRTEQRNQTTGKGNNGNGHNRKERPNGGKGEETILKGYSDTHDD